MIFVTVGTHEQPFNRLIQCVDELKRDGRIADDVFIQSGYSTYEPKYCEWSRLLPYKEMNRRIEEAGIIISHAGPSTFLAPLQLGKIPIVVPRMKKYDEHVNDHQVKFSRAVAERQKNIILVEDVDTLGDIINNYKAITADMSATVHSNNDKFIEQFEQIVDDLFRS